MESTEKTAPTPAPSRPVKQRIRRAVSPELAALVREEMEAFGATKATAAAVAKAAVDSATAVVAAAEARRNAALRAIACQFALAEADFIGWEGSGPDTVLILETPSPPENQ